MEARRITGAAAVAALMAVVVVPSPAQPPARAGDVATVTYCVHGRDADPAAVAEMATTAAAVWNDPQGWSLGGSLRFVEAAPCAFTLWLAADASVPSFGGACSRFYSCRHGDDVVVNADRWRNGSPYWPGDLAPYRAMVLNHELGHWLGFGHASCPGRGQPSPVMQQQSKGVGPCAPNSWPTAAERERLGATRRLPVLQPLRDGDIVYVEGDPAVWLVERQVRRHIPDVDTLRARSPQPAERPVPRHSLERLSVGRPVPGVSTPDTDDGILLTAPDLPVYVMAGGTRHAFPDPATFEADGQFWSDIRVRDRARIEAIAEGEPVRR